MTASVDELFHLGQEAESSLGSPKLPGVPSIKTIHHYVARSPSFVAVEPFLDAPYLGRDGALHDLLILSAAQCKVDPRVKPAYSSALRKFERQVFS